MDVSKVLPSFYLPPVSYFHQIKVNYSAICIDKYENYIKQSYRTRAIIGTANGPLNLIIPIVHEAKERKIMKDIKISYEFNWRRLHWLSIQTAYRSTPYFEFYEEEFADLYTLKEKYLIDFNSIQLERILKLLKIDRNIEYTDKYYESEPAVVDLRKEINPKARNSDNSGCLPYYQIFEDKIDFMADLSIVDLLFHQGPHAVNYF